MKIFRKLSCALLAFAMTITNAMAADTSFDELYGILTQKIYSGTMNFSFNNNLKSSLDFIEKYQQSAESNMAGENMPVDLKMLAESSFNSKADAVISYNMSSDYKKMEASYVINYNVPLTINENFKNTTEAKVGMWFKMDLTDSEKPYFDMIMSNPFMRKYMHMSTEDANMDTETLNQMKVFMNTEFIDKFYTDLKDIVKENSTVTKSGSSYTMKITDTGIKNIVNAIIDNYISVYSEYSTDDNFINTFKDIQKYCTEDFADVKLFGDKGLTITVNKKNNVIDKMNVCMDLDMNVRQLINIFDKEYTSDIITEDNSQVSCEINYDYIYSNVNKAVKIDYPKISKEDTIEYKDMISQKTIEPYVPTDEYLYFDSMPYFNNGQLYAPLKAMLTEAGFSDSDISYDNGKITVINSSNINISFNTMSFIIGDNNVIIDGVNHELSTPISENNGITYVTGEFLALINASIESFDWYYTDSQHFNYGVSYKIVNKI